MDVDLVLAPVDSSEEAERAAEYAIAVADRYGADLHLLHVLDERIARGLERGDLEAEAVADEHREFTADIEAELDAQEFDADFSYSTVAGYSASRLAQTPGSVVLDAADELAADFVVIPRETPGEDPEETLGKAALYVLEYASQPVLPV